MSANQTRRRSQIRQWQHLSSILEPSTAQRQALLSSAQNTIDHFFENLAHAKAYQNRQDAGQQLRTLTEPLTDMNQLFAVTSEALSTSGLQAASPGHLGFIPGGGLYIGAIADYLAASWNYFNTDRFSSPAAVAIHDAVIEWLRQMLGFPEGTRGDTTSGGSHGTLAAFLAARTAHRLTPENYHRCVVYTSRHTHHCASKALHVLFGDDIIVRQVDGIDHRIDVQVLESAIVRDKDAGLIPFMIVATAGTTNLGLIDPLAAIKKISQAHQLWFHIDAAYGGFFVLCDELGPAFAGIESADSIVLDPHKSMFLPYGSGVVMVSKGRYLVEGYSGKSPSAAAYLQDCKEDPWQDLSPMEYSLELSRPFRVLRLWLVRHLYGEAPIKAALTEKLNLARYAAQKLKTVPGIHIYQEPELSVFAFYLSRGAEADHNNQLTRRLLKYIQQDGRLFLSSTTIDQRFLIRVAILSHRTHLETIDTLLDVIRSGCQEVDDDCG